MHAHPVSGFVLRGWHVLASLVAFFAVIIVVNVLFAFAAVDTFPGEDVPHSYLQGLDYNQTLSARRAQAALGWRARAALRRSGAGAVLEVDLHDRQGAALTGAYIDAELRWPADARRDRALRFQDLGAGRYSAPLGALSPGDWDLRAHASRAGRALDFEADLTWQTGS